MSKVNSIARMYEIMEKFDWEQLDKLIMSKEYKDFILSRSPKEVELLNGEYKKRYYEEYRKFVLERKLTNTTPGATTIAPKLKKITNLICKTVIKFFVSENVEIICDGLENIPEVPVIFAHTHQNLLDGFVWIPNLDRHVIVLHHQDVNPLLILCQFNTGLILVKKDNKNNALNAKLDMTNLLLKGNSIAWFPEGTYCLSPNKLHLPVRFGIIDVAKKTGAPIIPVAHQFTYDYTGNKALITKIQTKYGKPIYVSENDDLLSKLDEYEESISTLKFEIMEENGEYKREDITNIEYINFVNELYKTIDLSGVDKVKERENIYRANEEFYKFHHINEIPFSDDGTFLETEEVRRLETINAEQEARRLDKLTNDFRASEDIKRAKLLAKILKK